MKRSKLSKVLLQNRMSIPKSVGAICRVLILATGLIHPISSHADEKTSITSWSTSFIIPFQYYETRNPLGKSTSFNLAGLGASLSRRIAGRVFLVGTYQINLNAATSEPLFSGLDGGLSWTLLGVEEVAMVNDRISAVIAPRHRFHVEAGMSQRSFDFSSLFGIEERAIAEAQRVELEGSFWGAYSRIRYDFSPGDGIERWGIFLQYLQSLPSEIRTTEITIIATGATYDFSLR